MEGFHAYMFDETPPDPDHDPHIVFGCIMVALCVILLVVLQ